MTSSRRDGMHEHPINKVIMLANVTCPYCFRSFSDGLKYNKEHVIGRKFVPTGSLHGMPNLLLRACHRCNGFKSDLEDDISVITMYPDAMGHYAVEDVRLRSDVARKAGKSKSRRTRRPVSEGEPPLTIRARMSNALSMTFTMRTPPQADQRRLFALAQMQIQGFFYWLTYNAELSRGYTWVGDFFPLLTVRRKDWGNPQIRGFEERTRDWLGRLMFSTADGFYKIWIRRESDTSPVWAWAIEWNQNFRLVGFFGNPEAVSAHLEALPKLEFDTLHESSDRFLRVRTEVPLEDAQDTLFSWDGDTSTV